MTAEGVGRRDRLVIAGAATLAVLVLYLPFLSAPFEYDDKVEILTNQVLRHPGDLREMVRYNPFRVLLLYTFAWDLWAWGFRPEGFRAANIAVHAANALLILGILDRVSARLVLPRARWFVVAGTAAFAIHPLAIESVTYISGRSSSLATFFVLLSTWLYLGHLHLQARPEVADWLKAAGRRRNVVLGAALVAGLLAGLPTAALVRAGTLDPTRGLGLAFGGAIALLGAGAALGLDRWRALPAGDPAGAEGGRRAARLHLLAFAAFVAGALTKEIAATLPGVLFAIEALVVQRSWRGALRSLTGRLFPFVAIPAFLILLRVAAYGYVASPSFIRPWTTNLLTQIEVVARYAGLFLVPYPQSIYHDHAEVLPPGTALTWALAACEGLALLAAIRWGRRAPALALGVLIVGGTLLPTSSVFALKETMVEHRTYLPSLGWALVVGATAHALAGRSRALAGLALSALLGGYAVLHVSYDLLWRSEEGLWTHAVSVNPDASEAWRYLGDLHLARNRPDEARRALEQAVRARPWNAEALSKLGMIHGRQGRLDLAEPRLREALRAAPCHTPALNNLAFLRRKQGRMQEAIDLYEESLDCNPDQAAAHIGLGHIYYSEVRDRQRAAEHYTRALEQLDPLHKDASMLKERILELTW
jgi:hypothetical protein